MRRTLLALLLALPSLCAQAEPAGTTAKSGSAKPVAPLRVVLVNDVYANYKRFIGQRDPLKLTRFDGPGSNRDVVEVVLLQQALHRGGEKRPLHFLLTDSESRNVKILASGEGDVSGASSWKTSADSNPAHITTSRPLIRDGQFMAGLYFPAGSPALDIVAAQPALVSRYTAVCVEAWTPDVITLTSLGSPVLYTESWESMLGMVKKKRADYVLAPFQPTADFRLNAGGMVMKPVRGVKVSLSGSRHFLLSRSIQHAAELQDALDRGLQQLEQEGVVTRAYRESGFENDAVRGWKLLNPARVAQ
jgi:hypothetical protein